MGPASLASNRLAPAQPLATPLPTHPLPALLAVLGRFLNSIDQLHCSTPNLASFAVLGRFLHSLNQFCHDEYDMRYSVSDYWVYDFAKIWQCSQDHSNNLVHEFFESHHFAAGIEAIPGAYDSLARLRGGCNLMVVTSRQHCIQEPTLEWLERHFPQIFSEVHFGNHFALEGASRKKSEICRAIGAEVLIDDNPSYAVECAQAGIHVLLYDWDHGYPWSKTADGPVHPRITRVRDWMEVEQVLGVLAAQAQA
ncbi:hypothetical protein COHA_003145 [Chlorella ohadii]|uniref:Uncharacterized protein n=1 Tax=Chlorella ohadii TaxID=2649997 RepID=A0AAD5DU21_9CHLO|nr:hypothetical protein COHA_003145 [Chlorella ohadii]